MAREPLPPHEFQLGVALSGGSARGAYSAGVLDFLLEALIEWQHAKDSSSAGLPPWSVRLNTIAGTSAGGIAASLAYSSITAYHKPLPREFKLGVDDPPRNNQLYRGWVSEFKYEDLLATDDLTEDIEEEPRVIRSFLNRDFIRSRPSLLTKDLPVNQPVPSWARDIELYVTIANLRGVPYSFPFDNALKQSSSKFHMLRHADYIGFKSGSYEDPQLFSVDLHADRESPAWKLVFDAATATSAFPGAFASQILSRPRDHYTNRIQDTPPDWPKSIDGDFTFNAVDGGVFNNEPLGIVRNALEKSAGTLESDASKAWGSMIFVDSSVNKSTRTTVPEGPVKPFSAVESLLDLLSATIEEACFKERELDQAMNVNDFKQYVISPVREGRTESQPLLATSILRSFGGLMDVRFRHHDFLLGRRNCQQFLKKHFGINVEDAKKNSVFNANEEYFKDKTGYIPIVPLVGTAEKECPLPTWPKLDEDDRNNVKASFGGYLKKRLDIIVMTYAENLEILQAPSWWRLVSRLWQSVVRGVVNIVSNKIYGHIEEAIDNALQVFK